MKDTPEDIKLQSDSFDADRAFHAWIGRFTGGLSPASLATATQDWALHLLGSPKKCAELGSLAFETAHKSWEVAYNDLICPSQEDKIRDKRFRDPAWSAPPFNLYRDWFLWQQAWWDAATTDLRGLEPRHQNMVHFVARQTLDLMSPANLALTNPVVIDRTARENGANLIRGAANWIDDFNQLVSASQATSPDFRVGSTIAQTNGDVIFRNHLIELIRYAPTTKTVQAEPVFIVPAWIMKYYILDLSPHNSMVAYLRDQGFEVFIISWKNPGQEDANVSMDDYVHEGVLAGLDAIKHLRPKQAVHGVGYCLGGTLLSVTAAAMARDGDNRLKTLSMLAAQVDFSEAGELSLFINESQITFLEDIMTTQGYLRADQMAGAFKMLRSNDLIWSRVIRHYLLGERTKMNDLMAWNADTTRMPARMHSEYLRLLFLKNELAKGRYKVHGQPVAIQDIKTPIFCLATEKDHVSPWRSVYKINLISDTNVTFVLTNGGHNGWVLSQPGHPRRHYRLGQKCEGQPHISADRWLQTTTEREGSWWPQWVSWLKERSSGKRPVDLKAPNALHRAPGTYVFG